MLLYSTRCATLNSRRNRCLALVSVPMHAGSVCTFPNDCRPKRRTQHARHHIDWKSRTERECKVDAAGIFWRSNNDDYWDWLRSSRSWGDPCSNRQAKSSKWEDIVGGILELNGEKWGFDQNCRLSLDE